MQGLQEPLRREGLLGTRVHLLSFTVDPARDTPAVLRGYAERYRAEPDAWRFLTDPESTAVPLIVDGFRRGVQALPPKPGTPDAGGRGAHEVMHSGSFLLIDRDWRVRALYDGADMDPEQVMADVRWLAR